MFEAVEAFESSELDEMLASLPDGPDLSNPYLAVAVAAAGGPAAWPQAGGPAEGAWERQRQQWRQEWRRERRQRQRQQEEGAAARWAQEKRQDDGGAAVVRPPPQQQQRHQRPPQQQRVQEQEAAAEVSFQQQQQPRRAREGAGAAGPLLHPEARALLRRLAGLWPGSWFRGGGGGAGGGAGSEDRAYRPAPRAGAGGAGGFAGGAPSAGPPPLPLLTPEAVAGINAAVRRLLRGCARGNCSFAGAGAPVGRRALGALLQGPGGPLWNRALALGVEEQVCPAVERLLFAAGGAARIVVGHSVQRGGRARARCGGRVLLLDTGMSGGMADAPAAGWVCRGRPPGSGQAPPGGPPSTLGPYSSEAAALDEEEDGGMGWRGAEAAVEEAAAAAEADAEAAAADGIAPGPGGAPASVILYADGVRQSV
jgi:hypothetical protein